MDPGEIDRLYTVGLERFVAERNELAKRLRRAGEREQAATVAGLAKPTPAAWAINGLARGEPDLIGELLDAGARLRDAVARAPGGDPDDLRGALRAQREAVRRLADRARETVRVQGRPLSSAMVERVQTTLLAAAADPELAERIRAGRLERDVEVTGAFELPTPAPSRPRAVRDAPTGEDSGSGATRQRRRAAEQHERATQRQRRDERHEREARQEREQQRRRAERQRREEERHEALVQLRLELEDRRAVERAAAERADAARSQLERARAAARAAEETLAGAEAEAAEMAREVDRLRSQLRALGAADG